jgi:2-methylcitrate dehydratase PrpD
VLGCTIAGAHVPECDQLLALASSLGGAPHATLVARPQRASAPLAALINATAGRAFDMDDLYEPGQMHASVAVVPAGLAVAEMLDRPIAGREFVAAVAVSVDLLARLSMAPRRDSNATGLSHTYHFGTFASAAMTARLLGCDARGMRNALGLALGMAAGTRQPNLEGAAAVRVQQGWAAHAGVMAGLMARHGIGAPAEVFEGRFGYFNVYLGGDYDPDVLVDGLGERFAVDDLTIKFYPACKYAHGAIEGILAVRQQHPFDEDAVRHVHVRVPHASFSSVCVPDDVKRAPSTVPEAQFSLPYLAAATLVRGRFTLDELSATALQDPVVRKWTRRVTVERDDRLAAPGALSAAAIEVELASGERLQHTVTRTAGDPERPASFAAIERKLADLVAAAPASSVPLEPVVRAVSRLEDLADVRELAALLRGR